MIQVEIPKIKYSQKYKMEVRQNKRDASTAWRWECEKEKAFRSLQYKLTLCDMICDGWHNTHH